uniref:hydroxymethylbilane synthase n=1 Tax=Schistocephalus solidus TaxID=70667 RepID=A0A0X3Q2A2_SCHSO
MEEVTKPARVIRVGSRKSQLALVQTNIIIEALQENFPDLRFEVVKIATKGDKILDVALSKIGDKNLFTKELENALYLKEVDFVVHSLKDVPTVMPPGLVLGCICNRVSPFDVVLMSNANRGKKLAELPRNSIVGTSALRRVAVLRRKYPHLDFSSIRGNLSTRLQKLDARRDTKNTDCESAHHPSTYDALILAEAGILRLGWQDRVDETLTDCMYAVGQGALACECRENDLEMQRLLMSIHDEPAALACIAERAFMSRLEGGCSTPMGVQTSLLPGGIAGADALAGRPRQLSMQAAVLSVDGSQCIKGHLNTLLPTSVPSIKAPGKRAADREGDPWLPPLKRARAWSGNWDSEPEESKDLWMKDEYSEEELKTAGDERAILLGLNVRPACAIARLRMARARRLGQELADQVRRAGADKILAAIIHPNVCTQSSSIPPADSHTQAPLKKAVLTDFAVMPTSRTV